MDHFAPHNGVTFEGYYSKFRLPSGASIALIISAVPAADDKKPSNEKSTSVLSTALSSVVSLVSNRILVVPSAAASHGQEKGKNHGGHPQSSTRSGPPAKPYMISFTYVSADATSHWQREYWPSQLDVSSITPASRPEDSKHGFDIRWNTGEFTWRSTSKDGLKPDRVSWKVDTSDFHFAAETIVGDKAVPGPLRGRSRTPWQKDVEASTPAGLLARAPLPIQWHVHSLDSPCQYDFSINQSGEQANRESANPDQHEMTVHPQDLGSHRFANVHIEKNWALTFPESYIWVQARDHERGEGVCLAGGTLVKGVQAYLVGYEGDRSITFTPPTSTSLFNLSLGLHSIVSFPERLVDIDLKGWFRRLHVVAKLKPENVDISGPGSGADTSNGNADGKSTARLGQQGSDPDALTRRPAGKTGETSLGHMPPPSFFNMSAPLSTGHAPAYCAQTFGATISTTVYERQWLGSAWSVLNGGWGEWKEVEKREWERGSLEFGGGFYRDHME